MQSNQAEESQKPLTTKEIVIEYFSDTPIMVDIARCESQFTQFNEDGTVHRGRVNRYDVGVMQINEKYHLDTAKKLNINIYTLEGNLEFARYLYEREGAKPWKHSSACWAKYTEIAKK